MFAPVIIHFNKFLGAKLLKPGKNQLRPAWQSLLPMPEAEAAVLRPRPSSKTRAPAQTNSDAAAKVHGRAKRRGGKACCSPYWPQVHIADIARGESASAGRVLPSPESKPPQWKTNAHRL